MFRHAFTATYKLDLQIWRCEELDVTKYLSDYGRLIMEDEAAEKIEQVAEFLTVRHASHGKILIFGNGASAALASHAGADFTKQAGIPTQTFHDPALITAFANDFGYDKWMEKAASFFAKSDDTIILISVSGESPSVVNTARWAKSLGLPVIALSGRSSENSLSKSADFSLRVPSHAYNVVESIHGIWLTAIIDKIIGQAVYEVS